MQEQNFSDIWNADNINTSLKEHYGDDEISVKTPEGKGKISFDDFIARLGRGDIIAFVDIPGDNDFGTVLPKHKEV